MRCLTNEVITHFKDEKVKGLKNVTVEDGPPTKFPKHMCSEVCPYCTWQSERLKGTLVKALQTFRRRFGDYFGTEVEKPKTLTYKDVVRQHQESHPDAASSTGAASSREVTWEQQWAPIDAPKEKEKWKALLPYYTDEPLKRMEKDYRHQMNLQKLREGAAMLPFRRHVQ